MVHPSCLLKQKQFASRYMLLAFYVLKYKMPDTAFLEKAEFQQILRRLNDIEYDVKAIKKDPEETDDVVERCRSVMRTLTKMRGFLAIIGS
jgi:hypothetical protein